MDITTLLENTAPSGQLRSCHGLSFFVSCRGRRFLFDMGPNAMFAQNAQQLGIDLGQVDYAAVSHGHYDHGGGVDVFLRRNEKAPVFFRPSAFARHTENGRPVGLRSSLKRHRRFIQAQAVHPICPGAVLFSDVSPGPWAPPDARSFFEDDLPDRFLHEQSLLFEEDGKLVLLAGCAHCGILPILQRAETLVGRMPDAVFGGLHLETCADRQFLTALAQELAAADVCIYAGHCTGELAFSVMGPILNGRLRRLHTGLQVTI